MRKFGPFLAPNRSCHISLTGEPFRHTHTKKYFQTIKMSKNDLVRTVCFFDFISQVYLNDCGSYM